MCSVTQLEQLVGTLPTKNSQIENSFYNNWKYQITNENGILMIEFASTNIHLLKSIIFEQ